MLIINYGQQKSASTFLALLTKEACAAAGSPQDVVRKRLLTGELAGRRKYWGFDLSPVPKLADQIAPDEHLALKTHAWYDASYAELFRHPNIRVLITYRHAGDAALSLYEDGERARQENDTNKPYFAKVTSHRMAIATMGNIIDRATIPWLKSGLGTSFSYTELFNNVSGILELLEEIVSLPRGRLAQNDTIRDLLSGKQRTHNYNKGVSGRHREVFSSEDLRYLEERCGKFNRFCNGEIGVEAL